MVGLVSVPSVNCAGKFQTGASTARFKAYHIHDYRIAPKGSTMALSKVPLFRSSVTRFADDDSGRTFAGYTDGRRWNGFACPQLPLEEFRRVLDVLLEWGDEKHYTVIGDRQVRVHGVAGIADEYVMNAMRCATTDGDRWLFDCGGAWTFVEIPQGAFS